MRSMVKRNLEKYLIDTLNNKKSFFLFGPRQTGKTTLLNSIKKKFRNVSEYSFLDTSLRQKVEREPYIIREEIKFKKPELVILDEVQKVPDILDEVQLMIDNKNTIFAISGSSMRKLKNLLAGRVLCFHLDCFNLQEKCSFFSSCRSTEVLKTILTYGDLPEISILTNDNKYKQAEDILKSYVETFLEEEIRKESMVRKIGSFNSFLSLSAEMSGKLVSLRGLSQDIGVSYHTISSYYKILAECMIIEEIKPLLPKSSRRRLSKSSKYIYFDLGVKNAASETLTYSGVNNAEWGVRFEQWVILEMIRYFRSRNSKVKVYYWRDHNGPEVDLVIDYNNIWIPVEIKFSNTVKKSHYRHLQFFLNEYKHKTEKAFIINLSDQSRQITENIISVPWFMLTDIFKIINKL